MQSKTLLHVRWWQIRKELRGIGLVYAAAVLLLLFVVICFLLIQYAITPNAFVVAGCVLLAVLSFHLNRKDKVFICRHLTHPRRQMFMEYLVFTLPLTVPALFTRQGWLFALFPLFIAGISRLNITLRETAKFRFLSRWIDPQDFEWLSGLRKTLPVMVFFYLAAWGLSWIMVAPLICLWLITVSIAAFYIECEPLCMLRARHSDPQALLFTKLKRHSMLLLAIALPVLVLNTIFCPAMLWINIGFIIIQLVLLHFAILLKYALYRPGMLLRGNNILLGIAALSGVTPFLLPVPLIMNIRNYRRAFSNLGNYYHDQDQ